AVPAADFLAELATDAGLLVDLDLAEVVGEVFRRRGDAIEGADVHANATPVAIVRVDDRDRPLLALEHLGYVPERVEDGLVRTDHAARPAVDAEGGLDQECLLGLAADRPRGAPLLAGGTPRAVLGDDRERHEPTLAEAQRRNNRIALDQRCISFSI